MKQSVWIVSMLILVSILAACGPNASTLSPMPVDVNSLQTQAVGTAYAALAHNAPTATMTPTVTLTPTITPTFTPSQTPTITLTPTKVQLSLENSIAIYMINVDNQGECKYYTFPIPVNHAITGDMLIDTEMAIRYLLATKWLESGILTNPLGTSNLQFVRIDLSGNLMEIRLTGIMSRYDDECTNYKARDQLWATASRYKPSSLTVSIWVDDLLYDDFMIGR